MSLETAARKLRTAQAAVPRAEERAAQIVAEARARVDAARRELAEQIRAADRAGMRQVDIVAATGYSRERIRQILREGTARAVKTASAGSTAAMP